MDRAITELLDELEEWEYEEDIENEDGVGKRKGAVGEHDSNCSKGTHAREKQLEWMTEEIRKKREERRCGRKERKGRNMTTMAVGH